MNDRIIRIVFYSLSFLMLAAFMLASRDAGISGDEEVHLNQSEMVYNYFATHGQDKSSLHTPKTFLQYYGQSFDNITTILIHWFQIEDTYGFRHLMSSVAGWLTIFITALFAVYLSGYSAGIIVLLLFFVSPVFLGHSLNNLKDIPFALAYISSIFFILKFFSTNDKLHWKTALLLTLSIAFAISIRAGGFLLLCYLWLYFFVFNGVVFIANKKFAIKNILNQLAWVFGISIAAYLLGLIFWPYALQNPLVNPLKSYMVMTKFPTTLRQIFEGQSYWSDFLPWYYLPKYMVITIPILVFAGLAMFFAFSKQLFRSKQALYFSFILFSIVFPAAFVIIQKSNLYGSWRHFLFIYPSIVLLSAIGFSKLFSFLKNKYYKILLAVAIIVMGVHPLKFMIHNSPYYYLYYNQFVGGLKGAYGNYETDYYYHSVREAAEWLGDYLKTQKITTSVKVGSNFSIHWYFRNQKNVSTSYFSYVERSRKDWDYAIIANSYIHPDKLKNKTWPPKNTIHVIYADSIPICAVIKRNTKFDYEGIKKLEAGQASDAILLLEEALKVDPQNEYLWYKYGWAQYESKAIEKAEFALNSGLKISQNDERILQLLGDLALAKGDTINATQYYENSIVANRKFVTSYVKLANIYTHSDIQKSRSLLRTCFQINPRYKTAVKALANSYRNSDPGIAKKYDELAKTLK